MPSVLRADESRIGLVSLVAVVLIASAYALMNKPDLAIQWLQA